MRLLLDTRNLLWTLSDDPQLSGKARKLIENAADIYVSAADGLFASPLRGRSGGDPGALAKQNGTSEWRFCVCFF